MDELPVMDRSVRAFGGPDHRIVCCHIASREPMSAKPVIESKQVGIALMGPYMLGVELSSLLLTAGLVGAYHLGKRKDDAAQTEDVTIHD